MKHPIKGYKNSSYPVGSVTQWFGENRPLYFERMGMEGHNGIDIVAPWGTPIYAVEGGVVVDIKESPEGYGKHIRILADADGNGYCNEWVYGHASENLVKLGDRVTEGQMVQKMGNTGFVVSGATPFWAYNPYAGTHLHLGLRLCRLNPVGFQYTPTSPKISVVDYHNGYFGSIDFKAKLDIETQEDPVIIMGLQLTVISLLNQIIAVLKKRRGL